MTTTSLKETHADWDPVIARAANEVHLSYPRLAREDLKQEAYFWWYRKNRYVAGIINDEEKNDEEKSRILYSALRNHLRGVCADDKAARLGYEIQDLVYYTSRELIVLLDKLYDRDSWLDKEKDENGGGRTKADPAHGGNALTVMVDLARGVDALPWKEQELFRARHVENLTFPAIGKRYEITEEAVRRRYDRAIDRLHRLMGGDRPTYELGHTGPGSRKAVSNSTAQARTHMDVGSG